MKRLPTQTPLVLKSPVQANNAGVAIERLERVALDQDVLGLLLALDVLFVEYLECVRSMWRVLVGDERDLHATHLSCVRRHYERPLTVLYEPSPRTSPN